MNIKLSSETSKAWRAKHTAQKVVAVYVTLLVAMLVAIYFLQSNFYWIRSLMIAASAIGIVGLLWLWLLYLSVHKMDLRTKTTIEPQYVEVKITINFLIIGVALPTLMTALIAVMMFIR